MPDPDEYFAVAVVRAGSEKRTVLCCRRPTPMEANLLYALGEHVSRVMSVDDVCHRVKISALTMRVHICRLRKKLHHDWAVVSVKNQGVMLCYIGSPLAEAELTRLELDPSAMRRTRVQSEAVRQKIRETQIRKESWRYFRSAV